MSRPPSPEPRPEPEKSVPRPDKFFMEVEGELKDEFVKACGLASMSAVTRMLWRWFVDLSPSERYALLSQMAEGGET